jgi:dephospho-CoA kinase
MKNLPCGKKQPMLNIGLTGGIGSGKTTVTDLFRKKGAYVIDLDAVVRFLEEPEGAAWKKIVENFGTEILNDDKTLNREMLGSIVFGDKEKMKKLNGLVRPVIFDEWQRRIRDIREKDKDAIIISDVPLLIEAGRQKNVDMVILVYTSPETQIKRVMKRNNYNRKEAEERLNSQMPIDEKIKYADFVINNERPLEEVEKDVDKIWSELTERAKAH